MNIVITTLSSLLNTNSSFNVKPVNFIKLIKNILEDNVYEIDVAIAAPTIPNLGIKNILNITTYDELKKVLEKKVVIAFQNEIKSGNTDKLNDLLKPENKKLLQDILEYHVYSGKVLSYRFFAIYIKK